MAWLSSFKQDTDTIGLGTVTIIYSGNDGYITQYSERCDTNDANALIDLCNRTKQNVENQIKGGNSVVNIINSVLNEVNKLSIDVDSEIPISIGLGPISKLGI